MLDVLLMAGRRHDRIVGGRSIRIEEGETSADDSTTADFFLGFGYSPHDFGVERFEFVPGIGRLEGEADDSHRRTYVHKIGKIAKLVAPAPLLTRSACIQSIAILAGLLLYAATEVST